MASADCSGTVHLVPEHQCIFAEDIECDDARADSPYEAVMDVLLHEDLAAKVWPASHSLMGLFASYTE